MEDRSEDEEEEAADMLEGQDGKKTLKTWGTYIISLIQGERKYHTAGDNVELEEKPNILSKESNKNNLHNRVFK